MSRLGLILLMALVWTAPARSADVAVALTDDVIEIDTGFSGARLTLFGALIGLDETLADVDIVSVIRGPDARLEIRKLERRHLIWTPGAAHIIENAPTLYLTNATRPINDIAPLPDQAAYHLGAGHAEAAPIIAPGGPLDDATRAQYMNAFLAETEEKGLYRDSVGGVSFKKGALFSINVDLPANTPVGAYDVAVYLYRDGVLLGRDTAKLLVNKVGLERRIYEIAHQRPVSYGISCVALSLLAGWIGALAFRKR